MMNTARVYVGFFFNDKLIWLLASDIEAKKQEFSYKNELSGNHNCDIFHNITNVKELSHQRIN